MRKIQLSFLKFIIIAYLFLLAINAFGEASLLSIKKGSKGDKSWAVLYFNEPAPWIGISQREAGLLSLYFIGDADKIDKSSITLGSMSEIRMKVEKVPQTPSYFRINLRCSDNLPLAVFKAGKNVVIGFNDPRLLEGKIGNQSEAYFRTSNLINVIPSVQGDRVTTTFQFDGIYDFRGFLRFDREELAVIIRGAQLSTDNSEFYFDNGPIQMIQFSSFNGNTRNLRADILMNPVSNFSIVRSSESLMIQTPLTVERRNESAVLAIQEETQSSLDQGAVAETALNTFQDSTQEDANDMIPDITDDASLQEEPFIEEVPVVEEDQDIPWNSNIDQFAFTGTPLRDALQLIATSNELNMVIHQDVKGTVRMNLENVTLKQALDMLVHTHGCEYFVENNIIIVKPVNVIFRGGRITKVYRLVYSDAVNVAKIVRTMVQNDSLVEVFHPEFLDFMESGKNRRAAAKVAVQGIRRSSVLVVTERPAKIKEIDELVRELDKPPVQIVIESKLVETAPNTTEKLGIDWDKTLSAQIWGQDQSFNTPTDYSFLNTDPSGGGTWQMGYLSAGQYKVVLDFLREKTDSKLISNPSVVTIDNEESSITVGTTVPVPQIQRGMGGTGDMVTFDYKEVNIQLNVIPHVGRDNKVTMYVNPIIEEITGWIEAGENNRAPITDKRSVNSIVTVKNGETVVIGGLIKKQKTLITKKVWLLGSIPLIGKLFEHKQYVDRTTNLMIFITPRIVELA